MLSADIRNIRVQINLLNADEADPRTRETIARVRELIGKLAATCETLAKRVESQEQVVATKRKIGLRRQRAR